VIAAMLAGLTAGVIHVLSGPDHLAAVAPIAVQSSRRSWSTGALWGLGHSTGVAGVGLLALAVRNWLPIDVLSSMSERVVGVVLIGLGLWGLHRAFRTHAHAHPHEHGPLTHEHFHLHDRTSAHAPDTGRGTHRHTHAAIVVGVLHGLAGSSHLFAVLPALALPGVSASAAYLGGYGAGTILGMMGFTSGIGWLGTHAGRRGPLAVRSLLSACSVAALAVGIVWLGT
jgi:Cytochrome C biogenesis protein transmembrane region